MRTYVFRLIVAACCIVSAWVHAQSSPPQSPPPPAPAAVKLPDGITEDMLAPPPVPRFMLEKPAKPLTMEEMQQQAREAERRAGIAPKISSNGPLAVERNPPQNR